MSPPHSWLYSWLGAKSKMLDQWPFSKYRVRNRRDSDSQGPLHICHSGQARHGNATSSVRLACRSLRLVHMVLLHAQYLPLSHGYSGRVQRPRNHLITTPRQDSVAARRDSVRIHTLTLETNVKRVALPAELVARIRAGEQVSAEEITAAQSHVSKGLPSAPVENDWLGPTTTSRSKKTTRRKNRK